MTSISVCGGRSRDPNGILHVVVGASPWASAPIRYRRHRLAAYLGNHESTMAVYWVYADPDPQPTRHARLETAGNHAVSFPSSGSLNKLWDLGIPTRRTVTLYNEALHRRRLAPLIERVSRHPASAKVLWFTKPVYSHLIRAYTWDQIVYDCSDHWAGEHDASTLKSRVLALVKSRSEERIIRDSKVLFASSRHLAGRLERMGRTPMLVENGVESDQFHAARTPEHLDGELAARPRLAFIGTLKEFKIDIRMLQCLAATAPEYNLILIGPLPQSSPLHEQLLRLPNVTWLGARQPAEIPGLMKLMDVGLLPYRETGYNHGVFPLKFFEYLAAGLPVVGCGLPSTSRYIEEGVYIHTKATPSDFLAGCREALSWGVNAGRLAIARAHDWNAKLTLMHESVVRSITSNVRSRDEPEC